MEETIKTESVETELPKITDKKRLAICGGSLGREEKSMVRGQVVDVGITDLMKADGLWDLVTGLFAGQEKVITPFLDFSLAPVRKPILTIEIWNEKEDKKILETEEFRGDEDGFFTYNIQKKMKPGKYIFHVMFKGIDSYRQYTKDIAHLNSHENSEITKSIVGKGKLRILPEDFQDYLTTSDIDQTYLATDIETAKGKLSALFETPDQKLALPGMPEFYRKLRGATKDTPLCFISASPHFFRRTLFSTIRRDRIEIESLHLKYLEGTIKGVIDKVFHTLLNVDDFLQEGVTPAMERIKKFLGSSYQSLFDQLTYKLSILLQDRIYQPKNAKEILLGDNTESDYFIFSLYQLILTGMIEKESLEDFLYNLNFLGRDAVTRDNAKKIRQLADECIATHGKKNSVHLVLINMTNMGPMIDEMWKNVKDALPESINLNSIPDFKNYISTEGAVGFAVILQSLGLFEFNDVIDIATSMVGGWNGKRVVDENYLLSLTRILSVPEYAENEKAVLHEVIEKALRY
ncbi:MAG: hypothetical protein L6Q54_03060 [Leptospiraceae bacterium]|nr:hypothetical protein [Leptospiraceae bacterium]MCK6380216.1 hypothetical protein [Leptospiraceae bacterium]NUM41324.1 hypothetical protein [Leptospiraceae bacterium]